MTAVEQAALIETIKENLEIKVTTDRQDGYKMIRVELFYADEIISSDWVYDL